MNRLLAFLFVAFFGALGQAHIPRVKTVLDRLAKTQGAGVYSIELEVQIPKGPEFVTVQESWLIKDGEALRVTALHDKEVFFVGTYKANQIQRQGLGLPATGTTGPEFFEGLFHARNGTTLSKQLIAKKIISAHTLEPKRTVSLRNPKYDQDPFIQWTKLNTQFFLGISPTPNAAAESRLWLEPDRFLIRKIKLSSTAELAAENYEPHPKGLMYPRERTISYGSKFISIKTSAIRVRADSAENQAPAALSVKTRDPQWTEAIQEFYSRFR